MSRVIDFADGVESNVTPETTTLPAANVSVTPAGSIESINAQAALQEISADVDALYDQKAEANGIATLDAQGKVPLTQIPATAITSVFVAADLTERDALTVETGDVCKVLDDGDGNVATYIYTGTTWEILQSDAALQIHIDDTSTHGVAGDIVGTSDAQVLTNKDFDGGTASNTSRLTVPKNTKSNLDSLTRKEATIVYATDEAKAYIDNGSTLIPVGSGSGGGINYIENGDAELASPAPSLYADSGTRPVDGTGGSVNTSTELDFYRSTSSPLRGSASWVFDKKSGDQQGKGGAFPFTIDVADKGKQASITFDYSVLSGTYATGDVAVYIVHDPSGTPKVIQPSAFNIENVGVESLARLTFQTEYSSVLDYRLCFHVASTSSSAYSLKFDNIVLGPQVVPMGAPVTDWVSYTPTYQNATGLAFNAPRASWRRVGDSMEIYFASSNITSAGSSGGIFAVNLPSGHLIDSSKVTIGGTGVAIPGGSFYDASGSPIMTPASIYFPDTSSFAFIASTSVQAISGNELASGDYLSAMFKVPIVGWSSSTVVSSSANTRVIALQATGNPSNSIGGTFGTMTWSSVTTRINKGGISFNPSTGEITLPVPGTYKFSAVTQVARTGGSATQYLAMEVRNTTTSTSYGLGASYWLSGGSEGNSVNGETLVEANAGDVVVFRIASQGTGLSYANTLTGTFINVEYLNGPSQIAREEIIEASYNSNTGLSLSAGVAAIKVYEDKITDTHNAYNTSTGVFTAPAPGYYAVAASAVSDSTSLAISDEFAIIFRKNSSEVYRDGVFSPVATTITQSARGYHQFWLNAGDTVDIQLLSDKAMTTNNVALRNTLHIHRLG